MKIDDNGQVAIPPEMQKKYGFKPGTEILFTPEAGGLFLTKVSAVEDSVIRRQQAEEWVRQVRGCTKGRMSTDQILLMTRGED